MSHVKVITVKDYFYKSGENQLGKWHRYSLKSTDGELYYTFKNDIAHGESGGPSFRELGDEAKSGDAPKVKVQFTPASNPKYGFEVESVERFEGASQEDLDAANPFAGIEDDEIPFEPEPPKKTADGKGSLFTDPDPVQRPAGMTQIMRMARCVGDGIRILDRAELEKDAMSVALIATTLYKDGWGGSS